MKTIFIPMALLFFAAMPLCGNAQYFNLLFDGDSSSDWGKNIFIEPDGSYFIIGNADKSTGAGLLALYISADGSQVISKTITRSSSCNYINDYSGRAKKLANGNYLLPVTIEWPKLHTDPSQGGGGPY